MLHKVWSWSRLAAFSLGVVVTASASAYYNSRPTTQTFTLYGPLATNSAQPLFQIQFTLPTAMHVGDARDVVETINNYGLATRDPATGEMEPVIVEYNLSVNDNCSVKPNTNPRDMGTQGMVLGLPGQNAIYDWTVTALKPGQCELSFTTTLGKRIMTAHATHQVDIYDRFTPAEWATIISSVIGALGLIIAALISSRPKHEKALPPAKSPILRP